MKRPSLRKFFNAVAIGGFAACMLSLLTLTIKRDGLSDEEVAFLRGKVAHSEKLTATQKTELNKHDLNEKKNAIFSYIGLGALATGLMSGAVSYLALGDKARANPADPQPEQAEQEEKKPAAKPPEVSVVLENEITLPAKVSFKSTRALPAAKNAATHKRS